MWAWQKGEGTSLGKCHPPSHPSQDAPTPLPPSTTYERLRAFIAERMRMSPIDQPLMLVELLGRRRPAPVQDVARRILGEDVTQIATSPNG